MRMALLVTQREMTEVIRDFNLLGPMIMMPALMGVVASLAVLGTAGADSSTVSVVVGTIGAEQLSPRWMQFYLELSEQQQGALVGTILKAMTLPLFWIVTVALTATIAADSFVGEKERDTLEPLLATPIKNGELFLGKLVAAVVPAILGTWLGLAIFTLAVWRSHNPYFPGFLLADPDWLASALIMVPLMALMSAGVAALISTRVATYRAAYQLNGLVVLPIITLIVPQTVLLFFLTPWALAILASGFFGLDALLIFIAIRIFDREQLLRGR
ncbi:MAG: transporter permease protein [Chloroflexi bacterium]|nr:transporter permease protein [Chloroflexota bacterium]